MSSFQLLSAGGGAAFGFLNFWFLVKIVRGFTDSEETKKWKVGALFFLKMALLLGTFGLILQKGYVSPLPFLAGFTVSLMVGIAFKVIKSPKS
jgi:hypothetical protein